MIRLGLRLAIAGGRRSVAALALTAVAVAVGTALLLLALSVQPAYAERSMRSDLFYSSSAVPEEPPASYTAVVTGGDAFRDQRIRDYGMVGMGVDPPRPAGLERLPAPGELLVSDALAELAAREPLLAERYPATAGRLQQDVVPSPDTLLAIRGIGVPAAAELESGDVGTVVEFAEPSPREYGPVLTIVIVIGAVAMLAPVVVFVATATRLTAASRERRMAALRLAGATNGQVARLAAVEALLVGVLGAVAGVGLFFLVRPLATYVTIDEPWYLSDIMPTPAGFATALVGVPLAALLGSQLALRRVVVSPLGVGRSARAEPLRPWWVLPLVLAVPLFAVAVLGGQVGGELLGLSFVLVLGSLLLAGPWLARVLGEVLARSGAPAAVLAGRRLTGDPRAGFRAVAGAVVGAFVAAMFLTLVPPVQTELAPAVSSGLAADAAVTYLDDDEDEAAEVRRVLDGVPGVSTTAVSTADLVGDDGSTSIGAVWIGECAPIARLTGNDPALCAPGRVLAAPGIGAVRFYDGTTTELRGEVVVALTPGGFDRPAAIAPPEAVGALPRQVVRVVGFTADPDTIERARTALLAAGVDAPLTTAALRTAMASSDNSKLGRVLLGAMLGTFVVAGCSAAVAAATGLLERRRSFALLRLTGVPLPVLRRSAVLELVTPLVVASVLAALLGVLTGRLIGLGGGADEPVPWLTLGAPLAIGLALATALGCLALPLIGRITGGDATRFE